MAGCDVNAGLSSDAPSQVRDAGQESSTHPAGPLHRQTDGSDPS
jgi:hypothetical protein